MGEATLRRGGGTDDDDDDDVSGGGGGSGGGDGAAAASSAAITGLSPGVLRDLYIGFVADCGLPPPTEASRRSVLAYWGPGGAGLGTARKDCAGKNMLPKDSPLRSKLHSVRGKPTVAACIFRRIAAVATGRAGGLNDVTPDEIMLVVSESFTHALALLPVGDPLRARDAQVAHLRRAMDFFGGSRAKGKMRRVVNATKSSLDHRGDWPGLGAPAGSSGQRSMTSFFSTTSTQSRDLASSPPATAAAAAVPRSDGDEPSSMSTGAEGGSRRGRPALPLVRQPPTLGGAATVRYMRCRRAGGSGGGGGAPAQSMTSLLPRVCPNQAPQHATHLPHTRCLVPPVHLRARPACLQVVTRKRSATAPRKGGRSKYGLGAPVGRFDTGTLPYKPTTDQAPIVRLRGVGGH